VSHALFLQSHVFLCRSPRHWVILDVSRDKYLCVDRRQFDSLGPRIRGWEKAPAHGIGEAEEPTREAMALADKLLSLAILSERADGAKDARPIVYSHPTDAVDSESREVTRGRRWIYARSFFWSCAKASRQLRKERFESIIASTRTRKVRDRNPAAFDIERARFLVAVFDSLRWFYPRAYICLFDSLALIHFLAGFRLYPDWVFGVKADPFEAHCWVQSDRIVLNDTVGRVSGFSPIMYL
jgi:hypothetical protein